ncbi:hypothetical protein JRO89_XSUnG0106500 [Xanthoceras sorbifolium]|uniref:WRKY domain-containing protein n=1 Tax=Xanthoceras sorbifolium TaxID=99658 RepID=A0ABQ8GYL2_9ROSI|nr:hypothetical protein JRO89_XSUnG0106500 [Xanthoceras sorbifolium]
MEKQKQQRQQQQPLELTFLHSGDLLRRNSDRVIDNSIDHDMPPIKEMDFFSRNNHSHDQDRKNESSTHLDSGVNIVYVVQTGLNLLTSSSGISRTANDDKSNTEKADKSNRMSAPQFMDPRPSTGLNVNEPSISDDRNQEVSVSPANTNEVISKKRGHPMFQIASGKQVSNEDGGDQTSQSWGSPTSQKVEQSKNEEQGQDQAPYRKARVSVRARSEAPLVQRCAEDRTILTTTYEGNHNHPLPPAATAMANTTSAAAAMLLSGSTTSKDALTSSGFFHSVPYASTMATLSASAPFPTITLDLTQNPNPMQFLRAAPQPATFPLPLHGFQQHLRQPMYGAPPKLPAMPNVQLGQRHSSMVETVTAAIASDPNFTSALAAAISTIIGTPRTHEGDNNSGETNNTAAINGATGLPGSPQLPQSCTTFSTN